MGMYPTDCTRREDPTPEEIAAECAKIRAGWSEARWRQEAQSNGGVLRLIELEKLYLGNRPKRSSD